RLAGAPVRVLRAPWALRRNGEVGAHPTYHRHGSLCQCHVARFRHGHRLFHSVAFYYPLRVPHLPSAYFQTSGAQTAFLSWNPFYATLRTFCEPSHRTYVLSQVDMIRAMTFCVASTSNGKYYVLHIYEPKSSQPVQLKVVV